MLYYPWVISVTCVNTYVQRCVCMSMDICTVCACSGGQRPMSGVLLSSYYCHFAVRGLNLRPHACKAPTTSSSLAHMSHGTCTLVSLLCDMVRVVLLAAHTLVTPSSCHGMFLTQGLGVHGFSLRNDSPLLWLVPFILPLLACDDPLCTAFPRALAPALGSSASCFLLVPSQCALTDVPSRRVPSRGTPAHSHLLGFSQIFRFAPGHSSFLL